MSEGEDFEESNGIGGERDGNEGNEVEELVGIEQNPKRLQRNIPK